MALGFVLHSAGVLAPGVSSLSELLTLRRTGKPNGSESMTLPAPMALPANERRRASHVVRLTLACVEQALRGSRYRADQLRCVFASDEGTGEVCEQMLEALATTGQVSPLLFHNSVHNAPSGYFSIAYGNRHPAVSVSLGSETFASGLLCAVSEASTSEEPVLFVTYDSPLTGPIRSLLPVEQATASAWIITSDAESRARHGESPSAQSSLGAFELSLQRADANCDQAPPQWIPASWSANSSARSLEVLGLLADGRGTCGFRLGAQCLRVTLVETRGSC